MTTSQWQDVSGFTAIGADGEKIGKVSQVYLNDATGQPEWVTVSTGLFGTKEASLRCTTPSPATARSGWR